MPTDLALFPSADLVPDSTAHRIGDHYDPATGWYSVDGVNFVRIIRRTLTETEIEYVQNMDMTGVRELLESSHEQIITPGAFSGYSPARRVPLSQIANDYGLSDADIERIRREYLPPTDPPTAPD